MTRVSSEQNVSWNSKKIFVRISQTYNEISDHAKLKVKNEN